MSDYHARIRDIPIGDPRLRRTATELASEADAEIAALRAERLGLRTARDDLQARVADLWLERDAVRAERDAALAKLAVAEEAFQKIVTRYDPHGNGSQYMAVVAKAALAAITTDAPFRATHRHKGGGLYRVTCEDRLEVTGDEAVRQVDYENEAGQKYGQAYDRFHDGRFTPITTDAEGGAE